MAGPNVTVKLVLQELVELGPGRAKSARVSYADATPTGQLHP